MKRLFNLLMFAFTSILSGMEERVSKYSSTIEELQEIIHYKFKKPKKLITALTTSKVDSKKNYEIYEFLGDSVLHLAVTDLLLKKHFPDTDPDTLTKARISLEENAILALLATKLNLEKFIIKTENQSLNNVILSDVIEAIIGAIYKDGGATAAQQFVHRFWLPMLDGKITLPISPMLLVNKWVKENQVETPDFACNKINKSNKQAVMNRYYKALAFVKLLPENYSQLLPIVPNDVNYIVSDRDKIAEPTWANKILSSNRIRLRKISRILGLRLKFQHKKSNVFDTKLNFLKLPEYTAQSNKSIAHAKELAAEQALNYWYEQLEQNNLDEKTKKFVEDAKINKEEKNARQRLKELSGCFNVDKPKYENTCKSTSFSSIAKLGELRSGYTRPYDTLRTAREDAATVLLSIWIHYVRDNYANFDNPKKYVEALTKYYGKKRPSYEHYRTGGKVTDPIHYYTKVLSPDKVVIIEGNVMPSTALADESAMKLTIEYLLKNNKS